MGSAVKKALADLNTPDVLKKIADIPSLKALYTQVTTHLQHISFNLVTDDATYPHAPVLEAAYPEQPTLRALKKSTKFLDPFSCERDSAI